MSDSSRNAGFTVVDLLMACFLVGLLLMLGCAGIGAADDSANRNACINRARQLALACANHENAMKLFPLATDAAAMKLGGRDRAMAGTPSGDKAAGYSWIVKILPYIEERILSTEIVHTTVKFAKPPFDPAHAFSSGNKLHIASRQLPVLRCPSSAINEHAQAAVYQNVAGGAASTNYVCIVGTNFEANDGDVVANGVIVHKSAARPKPTAGCRGWHGYRSFDSRH